MTLMISTFILVLAAVISIFISQIFPKISVSYIAMIAGGIISFFPMMGDRSDSFSSELFIGLVVAPLLFFEGQATPLNSVGKEIRHIIQTAVILVVVCMIVSGFGVALVGGIALPLAFILAAVATPTDATAMDSVTNGLKVPQNEGTFLKMESLFNDATGIILLNMAILWYVNGYINYGETLIDFLISAVGGVLFGFAVAWVMVMFRQILMRTSYNSLNAQMFLYVMTPFVLYFFSEQIHVSGIIAVVCAGLVHNAEAQRSKLLNASQIHLGFDLISLITEIFNSIVFVILGFMFVRIMETERLSLNSLNWVLIGFTIYVIDVLVRYIYGRIRLKFSNRSAWIFSLGGVHGAVTLALAYTLAEFHVKSGDFNLVLMAACVLIILSLLVPTFAFRFILDKDVTDEDADKELDKIRVEMVHRALAAVDKMYLPDRVKKSVKFDLMTQKQRTRARDFTRAWLEVVRHPEFTGPEKELEMRAFMNALSVERDYLDIISQSEVKYQNYVLQLYNEVLLAETLIIEPNTVAPEQEEKTED
ncbi:sodium:proton antiporter [Companilactobacillus sp.]|uniref:cation:proton antiporter n=1 Tax=Companilactobacillus sp. TaxID=2767905 RepID=UPI00260E506D|nr:sodium:proton antiporter [Companilactobacillus sp.]